MRWLVRFFYVPFMLIGVIAFAIWLVGEGYSWWLLIPVMLGAIILSLLAERILPYEVAWNHATGDVDRDMFHALVFGISVFNAVALLPFIAMLRFWEGVWPYHWPLWFQIPLAIVIADFGFMFAHFLSHKIYTLWRFHAIHHSVERLYGFNGFIKHPVQIAAEIIIASAPLILLGIDQQVAVLLGFSVGIILLVQHSNADFALGPFKYLLAIAPYHRFHHLKDPKDSECNYGLLLTVWDFLFRTYKFDNRRFKAGDLGIGNMPNYPKDFYMHMIYPFMKQETGSTAE